MTSLRAGLAHCRKMASVVIVYAILTFAAWCSTAFAADVGVTANKFILLDNLENGKAKTVYVSKMNSGIDKGPGGDPSLLTGAFEWYYTDTPSSVIGAFSLPSSHWIVDTDAVAKFVNTQAISCTPTCAKVVVIKPDTVAKFVALLGGDTGNGDIFTPPSASGGITTVLTINNGNDSSTHRMCTKFAADSGSTVAYKVIAGGTGRKIVAKNGVPTACP
jgi:hypothetical protein